MIKTFTKNDLIRFLYDELTEQESKELEQLLITDSELRSELEELKAVHKGLNKVTYSPSKDSVDKILEFSRQYTKQSV